MRRTPPVLGLFGAAGAVLTALMFLSANPAAAAASCSHWIRQANGTAWKECKSDDGTVRCYLRSAHRAAHEIVCR